VAMSQTSKLLISPSNLIIDCQTYMTEPTASENACPIRAVHRAGELTLLAAQGNVASPCPYVHIGCSTARNSHCPQLTGGKDIISMHLLFGHI
jgi:hypothetical protein